jgi:hypothetical protein
MRAGSSPCACATLCPQPCKSSKPKAGTIPRLGREHCAEVGGVGTRTADGSEAQKPIQAHAISRQNVCSHCPFTQAVGSTRRKSIGARELEERHVGPGDQKWSPTRCGSNPAKGVENPRSAAGRAREGPLVRPGREGSPVVAEHRAKGTRRCMTVGEWRMSEAVALDVTGRS